MMRVMVVMRVTVTVRVMGAPLCGQRVVWAAPGRRGALLAGFIVLIAGKVGGSGQRRATSQPRVAPQAGGAGVEASVPQPQQRAVPAGSTGSWEVRRAQPQWSSRAAHRNPGAPRHGISFCEGQHWGAVGWRQQDGGYGCLGWRWGLLRVELRGHPRREEGTEAHRGPWWDLLASSHREEPGRGMAWLVLGYVPLLEDDLPLPGRQLCLIVPESP